MNPQRVPEDGDAVTLLELEDLQPKRHEVASQHWCGSGRAGLLCAQLANLQTTLKDLA